LPDGLGVAVGLGVPDVMVVVPGEPGGCEFGGSDAGGDEKTTRGIPLLIKIFTSAPPYTVVPATGSVASTLPAGSDDVTGVATIVG